MSAHSHKKRLRQIFEASAISLFPSLNNQSGFFNVSIFLGNFCLELLLHIQSLITYLSIDKLFFLLFSSFLIFFFLSFKSFISHDDSIWITSLLCEDLMFERSYVLSLFPLFPVFY